MGSSQTEDRACVSCIGTWILYQWATREAPVLSPLNQFFLWQNPNFQSHFVGLYLDSPTSVLLDVWTREQRCYNFCSVTKSCLTLCDPMDCSMPGFPVLPPFSGACSQFCPLSQWFHPTLSSFVIPFCFPSFPASGSFPVSWLFASGGQSIRASVSVLPVNTQCWFPLGLAGLISCGPRDSQESSLTPQLESINSLVLSLLYGPTLTSMHKH